MDVIRRHFKKIITTGALLGVLSIVGLGISGGDGTAATLPRDCEATSIIYCGALTIDELKADYNSKDSGRYADIPAVFNHFGISSADINGMTASNTKRGIVKADNTVWLDGKLIGVNARTAGRSNKPGSTPIAGTGAFVRPPSASFANPSTEIDAFIGMKNGVPAWAVLSSCGNPVVWDKPNTEVEKTVRSADNKSWVENDTFANNSTLTYRILVKNTGKASDKNVIVKDTLPVGQTFVKGSVKINGKTTGVAGDALTGTGHKLAEVKAGATIEITFQAKVMADAKKCGDTPFTNKVRVDGDLTPPKEDTAGGKVRVVCVSISCVSLKASKLTAEKGQQITFTATAAVEHATVKTYEFRIGNSVVQNTASNRYVYTANQTGNFTATVTVKTDKGNATSAACQQKFTINDKPVCPHDPKLPPNHPNCKPPVEKCPYNNALPKNSPDCKKPVEKCPYNNALPKNHPDCVKPVEKCPYNNALPKNSPDCVKPQPCPYDANLHKDDQECVAPQPPVNNPPASPQVQGATTELPRTGAAGLVGMLAAASTGAGVLHGIYTRRRDQ